MRVASLWIFRTYKRRSKCLVSGVGKGINPAFAPYSPGKGEEGEKLGADRR
jgi:hypothetical protein